MSRAYSTNKRANNIDDNYTYIRISCFLALKKCTIVWVLHPRLYVFRSKDWLMSWCSIGTTERKQGPFRITLCWIGQQQSPVQIHSTLQQETLRFAGCASMTRWTVILEFDPKAETMINPKSLKLKAKKSKITVTASYSASQSIQLVRHERHHEPETGQRHGHVGWLASRLQAHLTWWTSQSSTLVHLWIGICPKLSSSKLC